MVSSCTGTLLTKALYQQAVFDAFADKSAAAAATEREEVELDDKTIGVLVKEEIERINAKHGIESSHAHQ